MADLARRKLKTPVGDAPVVPVLFIGGGMYLAWFGVHYWRSDVKYPTDPIKAILQGKALPDRKGTPTADQQAVLAAAKNEAAIAAASPAGAPSGTGQAPGTSTAGGRGSGSGSRDSNQNTAKLLAAAYGWSSGPQWDALVNLWNRESGWSNTADTRKSGLDAPDAAVFAYGIAQARPYNKYPKPGWPPDKGGQANPNAQISWGLSYIKGRYGSPEGAWAHEQAYNWY